MVWFPFADSICFCIGEVSFCDAGFHFMITPPEKAFWFHMIFYYT